MIPPSSENNPSRTIQWQKNLWSDAVMATVTANQQFAFYHLQQPKLQSPQVEWHEFDKDFASRNILENLIARLENVTTRLKNAKILHDYDNYQAALTHYAHTSFMAGTATPGYETKMNYIKQFFVEINKFLLHLKCLFFKKIKKGSFLFEKIEKVNF